MTTKGKYVDLKKKIGVFILFVGFMYQISLIDLTLQINLH